MSRKVKYKPNEYITKCPKCGNNTEFIAHSMQVTEDCCDVWVECICGYEPLYNGRQNRFEDVMGGVDDDNVRMTIEIWNENILEGGDIKKATLNSILKSPPFLSP